MRPTSDGGRSRTGKSVPTAIAVTSADLVLPPTDQQTPTAALLQAPENQALDQAIGDMHLLLEQHGYVIALYPSAIRPAHERRLHAIRSVLESDQIGRASCRERV